MQQIFEYLQTPPVQSAFQFLQQNKSSIFYTCLGLFCLKTVNQKLEEKGLFAKLRHGNLHFPTIENQSGGDIVAKILKINNIDKIFGLSGGHVAPIFVGCEKIGIQVVDVRHEANAVFAADATARLTGNIGVAVVTAGPGVTNCITPLKNAQMAQSPVLLIGGAAPILQKDQGALQDIDHISIVKSICKFTCRIVETRNIIPAMEKAIRIAKSGTPGPVFLEMPIDLIYEYKIMNKELQIFKPKDKGLVSSFIGWYLNNGHGLENWPAL